jgi:hypothetical protein
METMKYECKDCDKSFESKRELDDHNERNHAELGNKTENRQRNKDSKMDQKIEKREGKTDNNLRDEKK